MASRDGAQELVVLFDTSGRKIELEMRYGQFNGLLAQRATLDSHSASTVKAGYAQVGSGLTVQAVVLFLFKVNDAGYVDPAFNLPLDYMADNAGEGPDLGRGIISMACRSQCPVPWHAINMWEPDASGGVHPAMLVQKAVWRNRLGLKPVPVVHRAGGAVAELAAQPRLRQPQQADHIVSIDEAANGEIGVTRFRAMEDRLTATFGEAGRVSPSQYSRQYSRQHREQVGQIADQFRSEMQRQQQGYLDQIKGCREEIQKLRAALRHEQERNRRLQQLLRGDV